MLAVLVTSLHEYRSAYSISWTQFEKVYFFCTLNIVCPFEHSCWGLIPWASIEGGSNCIWPLEGDQHWIRPPGWNPIFEYCWFHKKKVERPEIIYTPLPHFLQCGNCTICTARRVSAYSAPCASRIFLWTWHNLESHGLLSRWSWLVACLWETVLFAAEVGRLTLNVDRIVSQAGSWTI